ncbi:MAG: HPr family phosphocarrier protein [Nocardioidaceae bacterium]
MKEMTVPERRVVVASRAGLHARPAAVFARAAGELSVSVQIAKDGMAPVDAASILALMTLGANEGDEVVLTAEGDGAEAALDTLAGLLGRELDE